uniref:CBS domain-containing protein n=1 Tax=Parascaris equorum TaxID=6256 RepID=A0A914RNY9_PAREQ
MFPPLSSSIMKRSCPFKYDESLERLCLSEEDELLVPIVSASMPSVVMKLCWSPVSLRGIITRKDVARFKEKRHKKKYSIRELFVSDFRG